MAEWFDDLFGGAVSDIRTKLMEGWFGKNFETPAGHAEPDREGVTPGATRGMAAELRDGVAAERSSLDRLEQEALRRGPDIHANLHDRGIDR